MSKTAWGSSYDFCMQGWLPEVLNVDLDRVSGWLAEQQPEEPSERVNWYLQVLALLNKPRPDARRTIVVIEQALAAQAMSPEEGAVRVANLAWRLGETSGLDSLEPDVVVHRCLTLFTIDYDRAVQLADAWRKQPHEMMDQHLETIRQLRRIKNLLTPVRGLAGRLTDPDLADEARRWLVLQPDLP